MSRDGEETLGPSSELPTSLKVLGDRYLSHEYVDKWAAGSLQDMMSEDKDSVSGFCMFIAIAFADFLSTD
jgi:hypothetical protein